MNPEILWYASRATGVVSAVLFTTVLVLGIVTGGQGTRRAATSTVVLLLHRWLTAVSLAFLAIHIATAVLDSYVSIPLQAVLVPFTSSYEPLWLGLGTVAVDLLVAIAVSGYLRRRLPEPVFRVMHRLAYLSWPVAMVHAVAMGTPDHRGFTVLALACVTAGCLALGWRLTHQSTDRRRRAAVAGQEWT